MKFSRYFAILVSALILWSAVDVFSTVPDPSTAPAGVAKTKDFAQVRSQAFKSLLSGDFTGGCALLDSAGALSVDDTLVKAKALTAEYLKIRVKSDTERKAELSAAVERVKLAGLARKYRPELLKAKLDEKLWAHVRSITDAVTSADEFLALNSTSQPADVRKDVFRHLDSADKELTSACALVVGRKGPWPEAFRASAKNLKRAVSDYRNVWRKYDSPDSRSVLKRASEDVHDALIDMGVLVTKEPLMAALVNASGAMELTDDSEAFRRQEWVAELVRDADKQGKKLIAEKKWLDALMIYGRDGLEGIEPDNVTFDEMRKKASRYVRVQSIYGIGGVSTSTTPEATTAPAMPESEEPKWKSMITGIDTVMVRTAVERIDDNYVKEPDYRKMGLAGLDAVRVLVTSSRAAETLSALKDEPKRLAFLKGIDRQIEQMRAAKSPDCIHVKKALNRVLDLNSDTLNLPIEVLNMEFAEGMLSTLDKFTSMIWPYQEENFRKRTLGSFCGVGIQIRKDPGRAIEVVTPLADAPAVRKGIRAGDYIIGVNGAETRIMELEHAVKLITGKRGTNVTLTIRRSGLSKPFDVTIQRDTIRIQTVKGWRRKPDGKWDFFIDPVERIGYIRLTQFTGDTADKLHRVLLNLRRANPPVRGIIVDMRFNPGGLLSAAEDVSDEFLARGLIVQIKGRRGQSLPKNATISGAYQRGKVIVLVNQQSASASEIVSGALKDWGRATIVGERTYGKGSVQRPMPLRSKLASLKLTTAYYYLPSGRCLHRTNGSKTWGVDPDVPVKVTIRQTNRWVEIRQETDILKSVGADRLAELLKKQLSEDVQLQTALLLMRLKLLAETQPAQPAQPAKAA